MQQTATALGTATACTVLACTDLVKERDFFQDTLGLKVDLMESMKGYAVVHGGRGSMIVCYERHQQPACDATAMTFFVDDLDAAMRELRGKGVRFEEYDRPGLKTTAGVAAQGDSTAAWFRDPAGNILSLTQLGDGPKREMSSIAGRQDI